MLPRKLYELLPYIYVFTGIVCAILIDSMIVLISSMLLIATGVFVLLMRRNYRRSSAKRYELYQALNETMPDDGFERRSGDERRQRKAREWPALGDADDRIVSDRRIGERRISFV